MLEGYYTQQEAKTPEAHQRLLAVRAALEIIKAAASNDSAFQTIKQAKEGINGLADAIQSALENNQE
ncbi:hypothetical protein [Sodalis sp. RH16]|uniref:hypothetical protein n=1 Tax=Sodalis sp. RH16 TaxID=3394331 RepID=UPI0039B68A52